jgi:diguanylate cyclase (GGDEF)-like protein/PAS domain S-box-containing protein
MNTVAIIKGTYDSRLVVLSILFAMIASYAALDLAGCVYSAKGRGRYLRIVAGACAMGLGIWTMHWIGMLAFIMPMPVFYHLPTLVLSLFAAISASAVALFVVSCPQIELKQEILGSVFMAIGIAGMHYLGMAAMRCMAVIVYDWRIVALSIVLAIAASQGALRIAVRRRDDKSITAYKFTGAFVMGIAISLMHYTGMWAASFRPSEVAPDLGKAIGISMVGVVSFSVGSFVVIGGAITSSFFDRVITLHKGDLDLVRERELYFQTMAEAVPEIIWTADPAGLIDYCNHNMTDYSGLKLEQLRGEGWTSVIHPDDVGVCTEKWQSALHSGQAYETEHRMRSKDKTYRWFLVRANPIHDASQTIVKWFGACTDIESQKTNEQILEQQILERTMQLADAKGQLEQEMAEKDMARRQLDQEHEKTMSDLQQRSERATMLARMGELLQSSVSRDEVIAVAISFAPKVFPTARGAVLLNSSRGFVDAVGSWGDCQLSAKEFETSECWALRTGQPHLVYADDSSVHCAHAPDLACSYLCIPILAQGETLGILHLQAKSNDIRLDGSELSFRTTFAGQIGLSIANIKLRDALRAQSIHDALTGLYNRRYLEEIMDREVRRAARGRQNVGFIIIDLDHFKRFNDTFGHDAGDAVLRETASVLTKGVRAEDFVCRYGGEEFVVILPTANLEAAEMRAENLRLKMKEVTIMHQGKSIGMITISVGVAVFPEHGTAAKELIAAADAALYEAKRSGRDQVIVASSNPAKDTTGLAEEKSAAATS